MIAIGVFTSVRYAGVVVRSGGDVRRPAGDVLMHAAVLDRSKLVDRKNLGNWDPRQWWAAVVLDHVQRRRRDLNGLDKANRVAVAVDGGDDLAVDAAIVLGGVLGRWTDALLLPAPTAQPAFSYPPEIRGVRRELGGPSKYARSAWDVAGRALAPNSTTPPADPTGGTR